MRKGVHEKEIKGRSPSVESRSGQSEKVKQALLRLSCNPKKPPVRPYDKDKVKEGRM